MDKDSKQNEQDRELWRRYSARSADEPELSEIDANVLAGYLDGAAGAQQIEQIESRMAWEPAFLQEIQELRELAGLDEKQSPAKLMGQVKAMLASRAKLRVGSAVGGRAERFSWRRHVEWPAAAAAVLLASLGGYNLGNSTSRGQLPAEYSVEAQVSPGLDDLLSEPVMGIILPENGPSRGE